MGRRPRGWYRKYTRGKGQGQGPYFFFERKKYQKETFSRETAFRLGFSLEFPGDRHALLTCYRILFTDFNFFHQTHYQLSRDGFQLKQLPSPLHQVGLLLRILPLDQLSLDMRQPPLQAAFFVQKGLVQLHKLAFADDPGHLV